MCTTAIILVKNGEKREHKTKVYK